MNMPQQPQGTVFSRYLTAKVLEIFNPWISTTTMYSPLRASRPLPKTKIDPEKFAMSYFTSTRDNCDFCNYEHNTAKDPFGRLEAPLAAIAANVFKFNSFHSLVFPKKHDGVNLSKEEFANIFYLAQTWFHKVYQFSNGKYSHPHLVFDILPHAGTSQGHPHLHIFPGEGHYFGQFRALSNAVENYPYGGPTKFFPDYIQSHFDLGLAIQVGRAVVLVPLDSHKDHELMLTFCDPL